MFSAHRNRKGGTMIEAGRQIRAGRALVGWSQAALAQAAGLHCNSVKAYEGRERINGGDAVAAIRTALEGQGVLFTNGGAILRDVAA